MNNYEYINKILELKQQNPTYEVIFFTGYDSLPDEDGYYYKHRISKVEVQFYAEYSDRLYNDEDELREDIGDNLHTHYEENNISLTEEELEIQIEKEFSNLNGELIIAVYTTI